MKIETSILIATVLAISSAFAQQDEHPFARTVQWRLVQMQPLAVAGGDLQLSETRSAIGGSAWGMRGWGQQGQVAPANPGFAAYPGPGFSGAAYPAAPASPVAAPAGGVYGQPGNVWGNRGWGQRG
ncbi:hypothetical protein LSTR_LSTR007278 [Laodelphax striatellus]|uniref:Uncharacterized protein n=1 Tax=Laodelphax striatellus TaxID=195883 RepID=A0A482XDZ0_LAOST|nr:hypothetical protein LSTR_LSTR007278 [Laodelphax striatellus]